MKKLFFFLFSIIFTEQSFSQNRVENFRMILHDDWRMQCSLTDKATGDQVSKKDFPVNGWYKITVPSTIIAGLIANHEYDFDPFYSQNFEIMKTINALTLLLPLFAFQSAKAQSQVYCL